MSQKRARLDAIAWEVLDNKVASSDTPAGLAASGRPANYVEFAELAARKDYEHAWSEFLHEFFRYKQASFFAVPPPRSLSPQRRALLAGVAEYLSNRYGLPLAGWVNEPEFFLDDLWDPWEDLGEFMEEGRPFRIEHSPEAFLRRNVVYEDRNLITL
jgi:hypothetical protein